MESKFWRLAALRKRGVQVVIRVDKGHVSGSWKRLGIISVAAIELRVYPTRESLHGPVSVVDRSDPDLYGS